MAARRDRGPIRQAMAVSEALAGLPGGVSTPTLVGNGIFPSEEVLEVQLKEGPSGRSGPRSRGPGCGRAQRVRGLRERDHEEQTADRIAEKLGLTQFLRRRNKKCGGRGRERGHPKPEAAPKREAAAQAPDGATERRSCA